MTKTRRMARQTSDNSAVVASPLDGTAEGPTAKNLATSKIAAVIALLEGEQGATLEEIATATSWQKHTIRASLTGLKKKSHTIEKTKRDAVTCYRVVAEG